MASVGDSDLLLQTRYASGVSATRRARASRWSSAAVGRFRRAAGLLLLVTVMIVGAAFGAGQRILARAAGPIRLGSAPLTVSIPLNENSWAIEAAAEREELALDLQGVDLNGPAGTYYEIYLDLPPEVKSPDPRSTNFVGRLTPETERLFDARGGTGTHIPYPIGDVIRALIIWRTWNPERLTITFVPRGGGSGQKGLPVRTSTVNARITGLLIRSAN